MVVLLDGLPGFAALSARTPEEQRYQYYKGQYQKTGNRVNYLEKDGKLYYCESTATIHFNKKLYIRHTSRRGFTLDKTTGKLTMWFKGNVDSLNFLSLLLKDLGHEWVINEGLLNLKPTKTQLQNILNGKITNPTEFCRKFLSGNRIKNMSPELLRKLAKESSKGTNVIDKYYLMRMAVIYKNLDHYFERRHPTMNVTGDFSIPYDPMGGTISNLEQMAMKLDEKIDARWSDARLEQVHREWSIRCREIEYTLAEEEVYTTEEPVLPEGFELIKSSKELFRESINLNHLAYDAFNYSISCGRHLAVKYRHGKEAVTAIVELKSELHIRTCYTPSGKGIDSNLELQIQKELFSDPVASKWFIEYFESRDPAKAVASDPVAIDFTSGVGTFELEPF